MASSKMSLRTPLGMFLIFYIWMSVPGLVSSQSTSCDSGWFGKDCKYECQCLGNLCPTNGQCSSCQSGWFGPACQYADFTQVSSLPSTQPLLTDNNDTTCLPATSNLTSLNVIWSIPYAFKWMRLTVQNPALLNTFTVVYNSTRVACSTQRIAAVNNQTLDIHCEQIGLVSQVTLMGSGVNSLCSIYVSGACDSGWFGKDCKYKCQCLGNLCPTNGQCSSCEPGWFGPACQYADLIPVSILLPTQPLLTDNSDTTCLPATSNLTSLNVIWSTIYAFTWMRLTVQNPALLNNITVSFNPTKVACNTQRIAAVNNKTLDIHCEQIGLVSQVTLMGSGVSSLCSIYVSGGRNVALRQSTSQSTTYDTYGPEKAVDGNSNSNFDTGNSCSSTNEETTPNWSVRFSLPEAVNRYVLYNRNTHQDKLKGFHLTSLNAANVLVYNYTDARIESLNIYTIPTITVSVSNVTIQQNGAGRLLTLCEVEIYGDTDCAAGKYGRNCEQRCNCANSSDPCFVSTGGCPSGCAVGYRGESCTKLCNPGKYGLHCGLSCSQNCMGGSTSCSNNNGTCLQGCKTGYKPPTCQEVCNPGKYGLQCGFSCSQNCMGSGTSCSNTDGTCLQGCKIGYKPPTCQKVNAGNSYKSSFGAIVRAVVGAVATLVIAMKF